MENMTLAGMAEKLHGTNPIFEGAEKITTKDLITAYPGGITITDVALITPRGKEPYAVFRFAENPALYWNGCQQAREIASLWIEYFEGDYNRLREVLAQDKTKFVLTVAYNKQGRQYTQVKAVNA